MLGKCSVHQKGMCRCNINPSEVDADILEEKVVNIFDKSDCDISPERTEACHRISKESSTVIVKFTKRKDCQQVWSVKRDVQKNKGGCFNWAEQNRHFSNRSLFPHYKVLWSKS